MSSIDGIGLAPPTRLPARGRPASGARFVLEPGAELGRPLPADAAAGVIGVGVLALQEIAAETVQDRTARRHGRALLHALSRLQRHLLGAADTVNVLDELASLAADMPHATDAALSAALDAVRLRARVELARHGR